MADRNKSMQMQFKSIPRYGALSKFMNSENYLCERYVHYPLHVSQCNQAIIDGPSM